jgi:RNA polymerase sigma-70 factor (ECF subfamily)
MADPAATAPMETDPVDAAGSIPPPLPVVPSGASPPFREIFEQHAAAVGRKLRYLGVAEADLMDAAQEVFLVVNRRHGEFEGRASLATWIHEICLRVASASRRRQRRRHEDVVAEPPETRVEASQDDGIEQRDRRRTLVELLDSLDEVHRQIVVLHEIERLPMREVAEIVGCPLQTAYGRRNAALEKMRARLSRVSPGDGR